VVAAAAEWQALSSRESALTAEATNPVAGRFRETAGLDTLTKIAIYTSKGSGRFMLTTQKSIECLNGLSRNSSIHIIKIEIDVAPLQIALNQWIADDCAVDFPPRLRGSTTYLIDALDMMLDVERLDTTRIKNSPMKKHSPFA